MTINLDELRAAASKVIAEEAHEFGWHVGTEATTYGTLSHVYTPDRMTDLEAHRIIATNMSDTDAQYLASLHPARLLALLSRLEQAEQAVERVREALSEVQTRGEKIRAKGNNGSIYQQERAARGEGYLEATRLAFRALDGDGRG